MVATPGKLLGQFFTPPAVVSSLMKWLHLSPGETFLDPSCGDGRFIGTHPRSVGIDCCPGSCADARRHSPSATVIEAEFFGWAARTRERFDAVGGNPPFIRYQSFTGTTRQLAQRLAAENGAQLSGLASSWAPFIVVATGLLKPGGRAAFVVPAEIGHATYAGPVVEALCAAFDEVHIVAVREKLFPDLSEDVWLLHARGYGGRTSRVSLSILDSFTWSDEPPAVTRHVSLDDYRRCGRRLRPCLLRSEVLDTYAELGRSTSVMRLSEMARVGIGYVSGANDFFHLTPREAEYLGVPEALLRVAVRRTDQLPDHDIDAEVVDGWLARNLPVLLLHLAGATEIPARVQGYLRSSAGQEASGAYKCRVREPWYAVPGVTQPDGFLSVMCHVTPRLVGNPYGCVCANSVHAVTMSNGLPFSAVREGWAHPLAQLSQELEGHPLGGGMLKLEPREAGRVAVPIASLRLRSADTQRLEEGIHTMRRWRHIVG